MTLSTPLGTAPPIAAQLDPSRTDRAPPKKKLPIVPIAVGVVASIIVLVVVLTRGSKPDPAARTRAVVEHHLKEAAARRATDKLVSASGDAALDHLLAARDLAPGDARVEAELKSLADTLELRGDVAAQANNLADAAAGYAGALDAVPDNAVVKRKLDAIEKRARTGER